MEFKFESVSGVARAESIGDKYQMLYEKVHDASKFTFNGKTPPRRILRSMVKDLNFLASE